jgi:hypothetical protein
MLVSRKMWKADDTVCMVCVELQGEQKYLTVLGQYVSVPLITVYYAELS